MTVAVIAAAALLTACGTSTFGPDGGSRSNTMTGVSVSGYPGGKPTYAGSPALGSSSEVQYSRIEGEAKTNTTEAPKEEAKPAEKK